MIENFTALYATVFYVTVIALANWHGTHTRCPRCGEPTRVSHAGWVRHCDNDGSDHFPRTDPAIIVLVHDGRQRAEVEDGHPQVGLGVGEVERLADLRQHHREGGEVEPLAEARGTEQEQQATLPFVEAVHVNHARATG